MENNCRILNRIVEINISNVKYADIELSGNTCFVGTNNFGKTSLQRAILFFYSANSRGLGISSSQKPFEEHYFRYENSYLIYEIATEEKSFFVMVYRHNKLVFRFVDAPFDPDFFFTANDEAMKIKDIIANLEKRGIYISNQIDTFERYRNIIYGTETDKQLSKFYLLKGNEKYQNIPKSITNVFLSSKSSVDSRFIKDFIANSLTNENSSIKLEQVERQLRQFNEKYSDIETYLKKESTQLIEMIDKKYDQVHMLKGAQMEMADKLGSSLRFAETQNEAIRDASKKKEEELEALTSEHETQKEHIESKQNDIREEIGYYDRTIRDANKKAKAYKDQNVEEALEKNQEREKLQVELNIARREYESLTSNVASIEMKYTTLIEQLRNDKTSYVNKINSRTSEIFNHYNELQLLQKNEYNKRDNELKQKRDEGVNEVSSEITAKQIEFNELKSEEKVIRTTRFYEDEIKDLESELAELRAVSYKNKSERAIKQNMVQTLQREWEALETKLKASLSNRVNQTNNEIIKIKNEIKDIEGKLNVQHDAFYGFLEKNVKNWHNTIGKVVNEKLLFRTDITPELKQETADTLYGISLNLDTVDVVSKSIEEYQFEKNERLAQIRDLEEALNVFQTSNNEEKMLAADKFGKQLGEMKEDVKVLTYSLELADKREQKLGGELEEWRSKAGIEVEQSLTGNRQRLNLIEEELSILNKKKNNLLNDFNNQFDKLKAYNEERLAELKERQETEISELEVEKKNQVKEFENKEDELSKEKETNFKSKGVDAKQLKSVESRMKEIQEALKEIEQYSQIISDYLKDKREIFDKLPDFIQKKEEFVKSNNDLTLQLEETMRKYTAKRLELNKQKKGYDEELIDFNNGINFYTKNFRETPVYTKYSDIIERAEAKRTNYNIMDLCTQLLKNDSHFNEEYGAFQRYVNEFAGKFRIDNHFNFVIRNDASQGEYERFAQNLRSFINENKIELSIAETATQIGLVTDSIATKVKELSGQKDKIQHIITLIAEDFKKAEFEESKLIEFIKIRLEESDNKVYKLLKRIQEFREENGLVYNEGLFNTDFATGQKREISGRAVKLLEQLRNAIKEQEQEEIRLQDLFELKFNIKEGMNETGWTHKIDSIGSTGTDILVKAIIYITLLHVFIKESSHRSSSDFKVHCIIDEVGQISAHYLRELLRFAKNRNIMMINGLPNKSGLESHYKYTYQFRREENNNVRIFPSIVTEVEA
ncbi:MAG: ATP-binding protein [Bacteroidota bacterium]|nr:ATP-binding protein [Bacteroidota bacterium]MDP3146083.1 ATP-binding protein [Bacteroidota bacterium]